MRGREIRAVDSPRKPLTVLIVDDDPDMVDILSILLRLGGHYPLEAFSGKEGLELARSERPDVILLDIMMPGVDGFEVFGELQRDPGSADIPVVFLTARTQEECRERALQMGVRAYITKPYSRKELLDTIHAAVTAVSGRGAEDVVRDAGMENGGPLPGTEVIRVAIIDDNHDEVRMVEETLAGVGADDYSVRSAGSLGRFLESPGGAVDIILLDLDLPDSTGIETLERIQREAGSVPVIVLAEMEDDAVAMEAVLRGAHDYLVKGQLDGRLLSRSIRYALDSKRAQDELDLQLDRLESVVEERTADLRELNRDLIEAGELLKQEVAERKRGQEEIGMLTRNLMEEEEEVKALVSRELHDQVAQSLSGLKMSLGSMRTLVKNPETPREDVAAKLALIETELTGTLSRVRNLLSGLRPPTLEHFGLGKAIEYHVSAFSDESGIAVDFSWDSVPDSLPREHELQLFRIVQEGLQNIRNHSGAVKAWLQLEGRDRSLRLVLGDNGRGFAVENLKEATLRGHFGLLGMRERAAIMHAELKVNSVPNEGTTITVEVPLE